MEGVPEIRSIAKVKFLRQWVGLSFVAVNVDVKIGSFELGGQKGGRLGPGATQ